MTDRLTTLDAVKAEIGTKTGATDDYLLSQIDAASDAIVSWCGRTFARASHVELFCASAEIVLANRPLLTIDVVTIDEKPVTNLSKLDADFSGAVLRYRGGWPGTFIAITYTAGYVLPGAQGRTLPADIERAAVLHVKRAVMARNRDPAQRSQVIGTGGTETSWFEPDPGVIAPEVSNLLTRHTEVMV